MSYKSILISLCCFALSSPAFAAGYTTADTSVTAMAAGGTATARKGDAAAAYKNPAATLFAPGLKVSLGAILAAPTLSAQATSFESQTEGGLSVPPHAHASYATQDFAIGASFTVPYGSGISWPADWTRRFDLVSADFKVLRTSLFLGGRYGMVSVAAGVLFDSAELQFVRNIDFISDEGTVSLDTAATAIGGHASIFIEPTDWLSLGAAWKGKTHFNLDGFASFQTPEEFQNRAANGPVNTSLTMPHQLSFGVETRIGNQIAINADVDVTLWSSVEQLAIDFEDEGTEDVFKERQWGTTVTPRLGVSYQPMDLLTLRAGAFYDPSPVPAETVGADSPDSSRLGISLGLGLTLPGGTAVDLAYQRIEFQGATSSATAENEAVTFGGGVHLAGIAVTYSI